MRISMTTPVFEQLFPYCVASECLLLSLDSDSYKMRPSICTAFHVVHSRCHIARVCGGHCLHPSTEGTLFKPGQNQLLPLAQPVSMIDK